MQRALRILLPCVLALAVVAAVEANQMSISIQHDTNKASAAASTTAAPGTAAPAQSAGVAQTPNAVQVTGSTLTVDGVANFKVKGFAYSPVPNGESTSYAPYGDYFTPDYAYLWQRDLAAIKATGANTIRIYSWANGVNHAPFLDTCARVGLKVLITHYLGDTSYTPVDSDDARSSAADAFAQHVAMYGDHPAILGWIVGNELNGSWNKFLTQFSDNGNCNWAIGCQNNADVGSQCFTASTCVYKQLFAFIDQLAAAGKQHTTRPMTTAFADVDGIVGGNPAADKLARFESLLTHVDFNTIQVYRGQSFGNYFQQYAAESKKPLLVGEYGVDAYNDPCGWQENSGQQLCFNPPLEAGQAGPGGSVPHDNFQGCQGGGSCALPGETAQAQWNQGLTKEVQNSAQVIGGVVVEWNDENWKGIGVQDFCTTPCPFDQLSTCSDPTSAQFAALTVGGSSPNCQPKAHVTCSNYNTSVHDLCGYWLQSPPDRYVNEEWFGVWSATDCNVGDEYGGHRMSALTPRAALSSLAEVWGGSAPAAQTCDQLQACWQCTQANALSDIVTGSCDSQCGLQFAVSKTTYSGSLSEYSAAPSRQVGWIVVIATLLAMLALRDNV